MTEHRKRVLRIERTFDAPVERVFEAWTSEEVLRRSLQDMPGWETPTAEVDLRVRGRIRIVMRDPSDGAEVGATGEYTVVEPPHRLVFNWVWDGWAPPSRPRVTATPNTHAAVGSSISSLDALPTPGCRWSHSPPGSWGSLWLCVPALTCSRRIAAAHSSSVADNNKRRLVGVAVLAVPMRVS